MKKQSAALTLISLVALIMFSITPASAETVKLAATVETSSSAPLVFPDKIDEAKVRQALLTMTGNAGDKIEPSLLPGIAEVLVGGDVLYITNDGRYIINGDLFDTKNTVNLSENIRSSRRVGLINEEMAKGRAITFKAKGETKHRVAVFSDIDCGYCRELHKHINELAELGIEVNYYMMPRSGENTPSYFKALNAVCAKDPHEALSKLMEGQTVEDIRCDDKRVIDSMALAQKLGIRGTPGIVTMSGAVIPGYRPPQELLQILDQIKASTNTP